MPELGEKCPQMTGTLAYTPLELILSEGVIAHESQDTYAMGVIAVLVCVAPENDQLNMLISTVREMMTV